MPVTNPVRTWLRLEGAAMLAAGITLWAALSGSWLWFALLFLVPDVSMAAYLVGTRFGAAGYNLAHSYALPVFLGIAGGVLDHRLTLLVAGLWLSHIGFDRLLGYGLKYPTSFRDTHLGEIGRKPRPGTGLHTDEFMAVQFEKYRAQVKSERVP
jgi:TctA family transporter